MDLESGRQQFLTYISKYRYVLAVLLVGLIIMLLPENKQEHSTTVTQEEIVKEDLQEELSQILSRIVGVGKCQILLTEASGTNTIYQTDVGQNGMNIDTVILTDSDREEFGLVKQVLSPVYRGAVVVCQGADSASVRLAVVDAVKSVTGLSSDCISVLKMK